MQVGWRRVPEQTTPGGTGSFGVGVFVGCRSPGAKETWEVERLSRGAGGVTSGDWPLGL